MNLKTFATRIATAVADAIPFTRRSTLAPRFEPPNVATAATVQTIQNYIRAAENGDTRNLFAYYRDLIISSSHVQSEFSKRKLALLGDPLSLLPGDKSKPEDVEARDACARAIEDCENWMDGLTYLLDSSLYPVSVVEHIFRPADDSGQRDQDSGLNLRYTLKRLEPVNYSLLCFRQPYAKTESRIQNPESRIEQWEPDLRFYATDAEGQLDWTYDNSYPADPNRHLVHRGHLLIGVRDNWGGPMRAIVFWHLLASLGRDWFGRFMERFGNPFIVGKTDSTNKEAVEFLQKALSLSTKIGGLVVDHETEIELKEAMISGGADGYEKFLGCCHREISKVIVGQDLSAQSAPTGLGSGVANLQAGVRQDIRMFDQIKLGETLTKQLFPRFLKINGLRGAPPKCSWGGLSPEEAARTGALLVSLAQAGLRPVDDAIVIISERLGFEVERDRSVLPGEVGSARDPGLAGAADIESKILNGAQVTALASMAEQVAQGLLPFETAKSIAIAAFPIIPTETINKIFAALKNFEPAPSGVAPASFSPTLRARLATFSAQNQMAEKLGVPPAWLNPLRDFLAALEAKAADESLSEQDLLDFLDKAVSRVPELFREMDVDELAKMLEASLGGAVLTEVRRGIKRENGGDQTIG